MANNTDGSITIDTELDNSGFEKGSQKLLSAIHNVCEQIRISGEAIEKSIYAAVPALQNMASTAQQVAQATQQANQAASQQGQSLGTVAAGAASAQSNLSGLEREINALSGGMRSISASAETGFANGKSVLAFDHRLTGVGEKLATVKAKLDAFATTKIPTDDYQWLTAAIAKAEAEYDKLLDRQAKMKGANVSVKSKSWKTLAYDISLVQEKLAAYKGDLASLEQAGQAFTLGANTDEYARMKASVDQTAAALERNRGLIDQEALAQARLNIQAAQEQVARANTASAQQAAMARLQEAQAQLNTLASAMADKGAPAETTISGWQRFGQVIKSAGAAAAKTVGTLAKASFTAVGKGIGAVVGKLKQFISHSRTAALGSNGLIRALTSLKTLLLTRIKRMFISSIVSGVQEGIRALARFSSEFDRSMSSIKNSTKGLSGNLSVSLGGLINSIAPILTKIINMVSTAVSYINALFALLGGKSTITVAKKQTDSYAKSLGGAAGAAEDLKDQVYGFDQLNKRNAQNDSGGGGGVTDPGDLFEEIPIDSLLPDEVKSFFERIKAAFEAGDWYGIGTVIADGLNLALGTVDDWITGKLQPAGVKWAGRMAEILNGLTDGFDWKLLGKTVADGINTVFDTVNTFLTTYRFDRLGAGLGDAVNGLFTSLNWDGICQTVVNGFNAVVQTVGTFFGTVDWAAIGAKFYNGIFGAIQNIDWAGVGQLISNAVIGLYTFLTSALENTDFYSVASSLTNGLVEMIANIDWLRLAGTLALYFIQSIAGSVQVILGALGGLFTGLADEFEKIGWDGIAGFFKGIGDAMATAGTWLKENVVDPVVKFVKDLFGINSPSKVFAEIGSNLIAGLLEGISKSWSSITGFFSGVVTGLKTSLSTAWENISTTTTRTWGTIKTNLSTTWQNLKTNASTTWDNIKTSAGKAWDNIKTTTSQKWQDIKTTVTQKWDNLKSTMKNTEWSSVGSNICTGIQNGINAGWSWLSKTVSTLAGNLLKSAKRALGIKSPSRLFRDEVGQNIGLGLAEGITDTEPKVLKTVSNLAKATADEFDPNGLSVAVEGSAMVSGLDAVAERLAGIAATFRSITDMLTSVGGLNVPQIAAGTVAPAKTRIDTSMGGLVCVSGLNEFADNYEMSAYEQSKTLKDILDVLKKKNLCIDITALTRAVNAENRSLDRMYGR